MINEIDFRKNFGKNLVCLRKQKGITQFQLAETLNYSDKAVSKWERGESIPDTYTVCSIAEFFGVPVGVLLGEHGSSDYTEFLQKDEFSDERAKLKPISIFIPFITVVGVFFIASIVFFVFKNIPSVEKYSYMSFIYAVPVSAIVLTVFASIWWKLRYQFICISSLIWTIGISIFITFSMENFKYIFVPCAIAQCVCILVYLFIYSLIKTNK